MVIKWGRNGEFLACPGYPECRNTMNFRREGDVVVPMKEEDVPTDEKCPECAAPMVMKRGRFGKFFACTRYPECKGTKSVPLGRALPQVRRATSPSAAPAGARPSTAARPTPSATSSPGTGPGARSARSARTPGCVDKFSKRDGAVVACPNKECGYRRAGADTAPAQAAH